MRIGILTWYDVLNYGSVFQAYALQEHLKNMGHHVEILQHDRALPDYYHNNINNLSISTLMRWVRNQTPNRIRYRIETKKKYDVFSLFRDKYLNITGHYSLAMDDVILLGSDQIFDINGLYYPFQFGDGISGKRISTYAPSFGETTMESLLSSGHYDEVEGYIKKISYVNARDINTEKILHTIRNEIIDIVLDPVLLFSFSSERKMWNKRLVDERYCIVYTWGGYTTTKSFADLCIRFARMNKLKLVSVGERRPWCDIQYSSASPIEFFELYMYCDMVLTNMFHGTCFSIIMQKPFYSFVMPHNENKLGFLLQSLNAESQILYSADDLKGTIPDINYKSINKTLKEKRVFSNASLMKALGIT